jgi:hypothetical protein
MLRRAEIEYLVPGTYSCRITMSEALAMLNRGQEERIDLSDLMCPICLSIFIEPVSMPCQHVLCMPCFQVRIHFFDCKVAVPR